MKKLFLLSVLLMFIIASVSAQTAPEGITAREALSVKSNVISNGANTCENQCIEGACI